MSLAEHQPHPGPSVPEWWQRAMAREQARCSNFDCEAAPLTSFSPNVGLCRVCSLLACLLVERRPCRIHPASTHLQVAVCRFDGQPFNASSHPTCECPALEPRWRCAQP